MKYSINNDTLIYHDDVESIRCGERPEEGTIKCIVIPGSVEEIGDNAFILMKTLEKVVFTEGLKKIGKEAFAYCYNLKEVVFPESLEDIGKKAFTECTALERIVISSKKEINVWDEAFADCINLREVDLGDTMDHTCLRINVFENTAFLNELRRKNPLVVIHGEVIDGKECQGDLTLPSHVKGISCGAFSGNTKLTSIVFPETANYISYSAFEGCTSLRKAVLSANIKELPEYIFKDCVSLEEVIYPQQEEQSIYGYALQNTDRKSVV